MNQLKKSIRILLPIIALIALFTFTMQLSAAPNPQITGGDVSACPGEQFSIVVNLEDNPGFTYLKLGLEYDKDALTLVSAMNGEVCEELTEGSFLIWSSVTNTTADGVLVTLIFEVNEYAPINKYDINISVVECSDYDEQDVLLNVGGASVDVYCPHDAHPEMFTSEITPPTCTAMGYTTYACDCGYSYVTDYVDATGHTYSGVSTEPTCTAMGYTTYTCACGDSYVADYTDAKGHTYLSTVTPATCTAMGYTTYACACGYTYVASCVDAFGHMYSTARVPATCTAMGYTTYTCVCGDSYVADYTDATGHTYSSATTEPTCTVMGYTTYNCACGSSYIGNYVDARGHAYTKVVTESTCTAMGYTTYACSCGYSYVANYVDEKGHYYGDWAVTVMATKESEGVKTRYCTRSCGAFETSTVPKLETNNLAIIAVSIIIISAEILLILGTAVFSIWFFKRKNLGRSVDKTNEGDEISAENPIEKTDKKADKGAEKNSDK